MTISALRPNSMCSVFDQLSDTPKLCEVSGQSTHFFRLHVIMSIYRPPCRHETPPSQHPGWHSASLDMSQIVVDMCHRVRERTEWGYAHHVGRSWSLACSCWRSWCARTYRRGVSPRGFAHARRHTWSPPILYWNLGEIRGHGHIPGPFLIWESAQCTGMRVNPRGRTGLTATGEAIVGCMSLQREFDWGWSANAAASSREDRMR